MVADDALGAVGAVGAPANQPVVVSAAAVSPARAPASAALGTHPGWWIGGLLLLAAAALLLVPVRTRP